MKPEGLKRSHWLKYNSYFALEHLLGYKSFKKHFGEKAKQLFMAIDRDFAGKKIENKVEIPALDASIVENNELNNYRKLLQKPVVFRGAAKDWDCTKKWTLEFFEEEFGDIEVFILDTIGAIDPDNPQKYEIISLRDYIGQLRNGSLKYLKFSSLVQDKMKLQEDLRLDWLKKFQTKGSFGARFYMFIGGKGTITPLHNEFSAVVYVQVHGRKKWILYAPDDRIFLDARTERKFYFYTKADPKKLNDDAHPLMKYGKQYEIILDPGDVLWFPVFAWHYVENLDDSIGVAYKFTNVADSFRASKMLTSLYFLSTNPNIFVNALAMRFTKNHADTRSAHG
jgi:lysine-specific demethylase 8